MFHTRVQSAQIQREIIQLNFSGLRLNELSFYKKDSKPGSMYL